MQRSRPDDDVLCDLEAVVAAEVARGRGILSEFHAAIPFEKSGRARAREELAVQALGALHGPPPGAADTRRAWGFRDAERRVREEHEAKRPRALRVLLEDGTVLWAREEARRG